MIEAITQNQVDAYIGETNAFLMKQRGVTLDGTQASQEVSTLVASRAELAKSILQSKEIPGTDYYISLSRKNVNRFDEAKAALVNYFVVVAGGLIGGSPKEKHLAVVSSDSLTEDNLRAKALRLHVLGYPYGDADGLLFGTKQVLSGAGQLELESTGSHEVRVPNINLEAEHFQALTSVSAKGGGQIAAWLNGRHFNHEWRKEPARSVVSESLKLPLGQDGFRTITLYEHQFRSGQAMILWHNRIVDEATGNPAMANAENGLLYVQALGYNALQNIPDAVDNLKELIS